MRSVTMRTPLSRVVSSTPGSRTAADPGAVPPSGDGTRSGPVAVMSAAPATAIAAAAPPAT